MRALKPLIAIATVVGLSAALLAYSESQRTDVATTYARDGSLQSVVSVDKSGLMHGPATFYFPDGTIQTEIIHERGTVIARNQYYPSGRLQETYREGSGFAVEVQRFPDSDD
jgi:antitoxin component YwqK of YwqJK toxin-antitoxin module